MATGPQDGCLASMNVALKPLLMSQSNTLECNEIFASLCIFNLAVVWNRVCVDREIKAAAL